AVIYFMMLTGLSTSERALDFLVARDFDLEAALALYGSWKACQFAVGEFFKTTGPPFHAVFSTPLFQLLGTTDRFGSPIVLVNMEFWRPS
ncbi:hypothetical protein HK405_013122, partial [Cladochytrium tenue]